MLLMRVSFLGVYTLCNLVSGGEGVVMSIYVYMYYVGVPSWFPFLFKNSPLHIPHLGAIPLVWSLAIYSNQACVGGTNSVAGEVVHTH